MKNNNRRFPNLGGFNAVRVTKINTVVRCIQHKEIVKEESKGDFVVKIWTRDISWESWCCMDQITNRLQS
jgi:hypothetical protein